MTIWHLLALFLSVVGYQNSNRIIQKKYQYIGLKRKGFFQRTGYYYREGDEAVAIGKVRRLLSLLFALATIIDIFVPYNLLFPSIVIVLVVLNIVEIVAYPVKLQGSESSD